MPHQRNSLCEEGHTKPETRQYVRIVALGSINIGICIWAEQLQGHGTLMPLGNSQLPHQYVFFACDFATFFTTPHQAETMTLSSLISDSWCSVCCTVGIQCLLVELNWTELLCFKGNCDCSYYDYNLCIKI